MAHTILNQFIKGECPSQQLAAGVLERRLCVALLHWFGAPSISIKYLFKESKTQILCLG